MYKLILCAFLVISVVLICLIMFQQEKNADIKSSFTSNSINNLFTPKNTESTINKMIKILATLFIFISLILNNLSSDEIKNKKWLNLGQDSVNTKKYNDI